MEVPQAVIDLIRVRVPEPNKAVEENPLVKFLKELAAKLEEE